MSDRQEMYSDAMSEDKTIKSKVMPAEKPDQISHSEEKKEESEAQPSINEEEDGECLELQADFENDDEYYKSIFPNESPQHCSSFGVPTKTASEPATEEIEEKTKTLSSERSVE